MVIYVADDYLKNAEISKTVNLNLNIVSLQEYFFFTKNGS